VAWSAKGICNVSDEQPRPVIFGEVLFDCFPDGSTVLGGAPFNVAWHLQAFQAAPLLISRVGDDPLGRHIRAAMQAWGMDCSGLQLDSAHPTGTVEVRLEQGEPSYEIVSRRAYDFVDASALPPPPAGGILYHGSLALRQAESRGALRELRDTLGFPGFVDVNLRDPWWDRDTVLESLGRARWAKLNEHELRTLAPAGQDLEACVRLLFEATGLQLVLTTRGARGAVVRSREGAVAEVVPRQDTGTLIDAVGAGDAFASVFLLGLLREWDLDACLERAQSFASALLGVRGATVSDPGFYQRFLDAWEIR
jgi:fructokinase